MKSLHLDYYDYCFLKITEAAATMNESVCLANMKTVGKISRRNRETFNFEHERMADCVLNYFSCFCYFCLLI